MSSTAPQTAEDTAAATNNGQQQLVTVPASPELALAEQTIAIEERKFALAQRQARVYAESALVPQHYRNNIGNVLIAQNMATRMGADLLMVMQNLYVVHGNPGWSSQFLIATFNSCGRFSALKYRSEGGPNDLDNWKCQAYCTELATGEEITGTWITWTMAVAEGWATKTGSKWKTMPEQMFKYRSATFLIRSTAPEIAMGLLTKEELEDMGDNGNSGSLAEKTRGRLDSLRDRLTPPSATDDEPEVIDAEFVDSPARDTENYDMSDVGEIPVGTVTVDPATKPKKSPKKLGDDVPTQPMSVARVVNVATTLQKKHGIAADDLAMQFLPEGKTLFSQLTGAEADEILPSLEEMLATREAA